MFTSLLKQENNHIPWLEPACFQGLFQSSAQMVTTTAIFGKLHPPVTRKLSHFLESHKQCSYLYLFKKNISKQNLTSDWIYGICLFKLETNFSRSFTPNALQTEKVCTECTDQFVRVLRLHLTRNPIFLAIYFRNISTPHSEVNTKINSCLKSRCCDTGSLLTGINFLSHMQTRQSSHTNSRCTAVITR